MINLSMQNALHCLCYLTASYPCQLDLHSEPSGLNAVKIIWNSYHLPKEYSVCRPSVIDKLQTDMYFSLFLYLDRYLIAPSEYHYYLSLAHDLDALYSLAYQHIVKFSYSSAVLVEAFYHHIYLFLLNLRGLALCFQRFQLCTQVYFLATANPPSPRPKNKIMIQLL